LKVGIIGAGTMGAGIAQAFATNTDYNVILCDISTEYAEQGKKRISVILDKEIKKARISSSEADSILSRIETGVIGSVRDSDLVIEAAQENLEVKREIFKTLQEICSNDCIFTTNTSSLSISEIAKDLDHPIVGLHFFNPAPIMPLVEIIQGMEKNSDIILKLKNTCTDIGKTVIEVKESPGFVVNRILIPMINEAIFVLSEGIASAEDIDSAMRLGANHPIGPLALSDLIGNDIVLNIMQVLHNETGDDKYRPSYYLKKIVRGGKLGRKTGEGFFKYK